MITLDYINIFTPDIDRLADFYQTLFDLEEIIESRSPIFRGFHAGGVTIGFSGPGAHDLLGLVPQNVSGDRILQTFSAFDEIAVGSLTDRAVSLGATLVKAPFRTYYGWIQSVLRDPDGNAFRINFSGPIR